MGISEVKRQELEGLLSTITPFDIRANLFKRRDFEFIVTGKDEDGNVRTHEKQRQALEILTSNEYEELLYGGGAGGAKSYTGCAWLLFMCVNYPETRWFVARNELGDIVDSVLVTFNKVCRDYGFSGFKYNGQKNFIQFDNGSFINFIEVKYKPSDPLYEDLGSTEYTGGWIEEVGEINKMAYDVLKTRIGRHLNRKYGLKKMLFMTCNPKKNWAKIEFYDKHNSGTLEDHKQYLSCLVTENPFIQKDYAQSLERMASSNKALYERLYKGNWDYEDSPDALCDYEMVEQVFDNDHVRSGKTYLTADIARLGSDKAVIFVWSGWKIIDKAIYDLSKITEIAMAIEIFRRKYRIPKNRCIADADGVGGGVIDMTGIKGFVNNSAPIKEGRETPNYRNLQVQCLYHLADKINEGGLWIACDLNDTQRKEIKEELDQIRSVVGRMGKLDCKHKDDIKKDIQRSPDYRDAIFMRVYFDLKPTRRPLITRIPG